MLNSIKAYAKINLHLEILNKRVDGYHNIFSIMAKVDIFDLLQLIEYQLCDPEETSINITCNGGLNESLAKSIPLEQNLITKAIYTYCKKARIGLKATIDLKKNIPAGAGLGGGSTDAAAALLLCNNVVHRFNYNELLQIAREIGADVPFCLNGNIAACEGIGDIITPLKPINFPNFIVLIYDGILCSTKNAYNLLKRDHTVRNSLKDIILYHWEHEDGSSLLKIFKNDFKEVIFNENPELISIYNTLKEYKPDFIQLTGSGSAIYALFYDSKNASEAFSEVNTKYEQVFLSKLLM